ncbi:hypothetical protein BASA81_004129 [Batrachochytrium salamandrivorans]|nr:hypothetical protein BASA81_004129 [Batrachochytrium salamandrivorans]
MFGQPPPAGGQPPVTSFSFGAPSTPAAGTFGFGAAATSAAPAAAPAASGGLFGAAPAAAPAASGGLFGAATPAAAAPASGGLFGATPAAGGLFGAPPAPAAPTASTGGLFGAPPAPAAPAASTGGLFGAPPADAAPAASSGGFAATPAPVASSGGLFGSEPPSTPAPSSSTIVAGQTAPTDPRAAAASVELKGLTVDKILFKWRETLQDHTDRFQKATIKVQERDLVLLNSQKHLTKLAQEGRVLKETHGELLTQLDNVNSLFSDLETGLASMETDLAALEAKTNVGETTTKYDKDADAEREAAYRLGEQLDKQTIKVEQDLKAVIGRLNQGGGARGGEYKRTTNADVLQQLNRHQANMEWIDNETKALELELEALSSQRYN